MRSGVAGFHGLRTEGWWLRTEGWWLRTEGFFFLFYRSNMRWYL